MHIVRVVALRRLREFWEAGHADAEGPLRAWFRSVEKAAWTGYADVRAASSSVDQLGDKLIFNIGGNKDRLVVAVDYARSGVLVKWIGTHAEYDKLKVEEL
jgi:mRNA interferase HigB